MDACTHTHTHTHYVPRDVLAIGENGFKCFSPVILYLFLILGGLVSYAPCLPPEYTSMWFSEPNWKIVPGFIAVARPTAVIVLLSPATMMGCYFFINQNVTNTTEFHNSMNKQFLLILPNTRLQILHILQSQCLS